MTRSTARGLWRALGVRLRERQARVPFRSLSPLQRYQSGPAFAERDQRLVDLLDAELARLDWQEALAIRWWSRGIVGVDTTYSSREYGSYYHLVVALPDGRAWNAWLPFIALPEIIAGASSSEGEIELGVFYGDLETIAFEVRDAIATRTGRTTRHAQTTSNAGGVLDLTQLDGLGELRTEGPGTALALNANVQLFQWQTPDNATCIIPIETDDPAVEIQDITTFEQFPGQHIRSTDDGQRWEMRTLNKPHPPR